jgi:precorrin-6B methylase 2
MLIEILFTFTFAIMFVLGVVIFYAYVFLAPWVPTPAKELQRINRLAALRPGDVFYEVGCGTARVSAFIAKNNPHSQVIGIELVPPLYLVARLGKALSGLKNLHIEFGDAFERDYSGADVVYVYGLPRTVNGKLKTKLEKELKPGARLISYAFTVREWNGSGQKDKSSKEQTGINVYTKGGS